MISPSGPGDWPIAWDELPDARRVPDADKPMMGALAAATLWAATGRRFGLVVCTHTVGNHRRPGICWPDPDFVLDLPGPVYDIIAVVSGTVTFPMTAYTRAGDQLVRVDGQPWPAAAVVITYRRGMPVPVGGDHAAAELAAEILAGRRGGKCRLPARTTSVSREGVDVALGDPLDYLNAGLTGVPEVDTWILTHNPYGMRQDSIVWTPDLAGPPQLAPYWARGITRIGRAW